MLHRNQYSLLFNGVRKEIGSAVGQLSLYSRKFLKLSYIDFY